MPDFKISEIHHSSGRVTYLVSGSLPGEGQIKKRFETRDAADSAKLDFDRKRELALLRHTRREVRLMETTLTREQLTQAQAAFASLAARKETRKLIEVVEAGLGVKPRAPDRPLLEILPQFIKEKRDQKKLAPRSIDSLETRLTRFVEQVPDSPSEDNVRAWIFADGLTRTQINRRADVGNFLRWAVRKGYRDDHFMGSIERPKVPDKEIEPVAVLTPHQAGALLSAARKVEGGILTAYVALATWGGIRAGELDELTGDAINLKRREVSIGRERTESHRILSMEPNLVSILQTCSLMGNICPVNFRRIFATVRTVAGLFDEWKEDTMRHSYGSYHINKYHEVGLTARMMGNSPSVVFRNYHNPRPAEDVQAFWAIS